MAIISHKIKKDKMLNTTTVSATLLTELIGSSVASAVFSTALVKTNADITPITKEITIHSQKLSMTQTQLKIRHQHFTILKTSHYHALHSKRRTNIINGSHLNTCTLQGHFFIILLPLFQFGFSFHHTRSTQDLSLHKETMATIQM